MSDAEKAALEAVLLAQRAVQLAKQLCASAGCDGHGVSLSLARAADDLADCRYVLEA